MEPITYFATVENGTLKGHNRTKIALELEAFEGKRVEVIIRKAKKQRSNLQNRYYWGVIVPSIQFGIKETQGFSPSKEATHQWLSQRFNVLEIANVNTGEVSVFPKSTADLSTSEFCDYTEKCRQFAYEFLNIHIPQPNEQALIFTEQ